MGNHTVLLNPDKGYPANGVELVFPLKWMHNFLKNPEIGNPINLRMILDFLTCFNGDFTDSIDWPEYDIDNPSKANAKEANHEELLGWLQALTDMLFSGTLTNLTDTEVAELLTKLIPFSVLTGWDMEIGSQDWGFLIHLLANYPDLDEIRVQVGDTSLLSVLASGAIDSVGSLRVTSLKGWFDFDTLHRSPEGKIVDYKDVYEKDLDPRYMKNMDIIEFLTANTVYPPALYKWGERGSHYASINKKVIK